jgi:ribosomal protein L11 methyltransferase
VAVRVAAARAEETRALMLELFPEGFEDVEEGSEVELAGYTAAEEDEILARLPGSVSVSDVESGWEERWRQFHKPIRVGPLWVGPPWERADGEAHPVVIDPGRAFGTGAHPTTRLCLELLLEAQRGSLLDLGCGSGVLAIAAARLGFAPVFALDVDEVAVNAARANASANAVAVDVRHWDVLAEPLPPVDLAVANLTHALVERVAGRIPARRLIASGYLVGETPAASAWRVVERREADGWAADLLERLYD